MIKAKTGYTIATSNNLVLVFWLLALSAFTALIFIRNRSQVSCRIASLKKFAKVIGKNWNHENLLKNCLRDRCFSLGWAKKFQNLFVMEFHQSTAFEFCTFMSRFRHPLKIMIWFLLISWKLSCLRCEEIGNICDVSNSLLFMSMPFIWWSWCFFSLFFMYKHPTMCYFFIYLISR